MKTFILIISTFFLVNCYSQGSSLEPVVAIEENDFSLENLPGDTTCVKKNDVSSVLITSGLTAIGCGSLSWFSSRYTSITFIALGGASVLTGYTIRFFKNRKKG